MGSLQNTPTINGNGGMPKPRVPFPQRVWLRTAKQQTALETYASNISESGIFVQTTNPPEVGSRVLIQFQIQSSGQNIEALAEVVWVKPFEPINIDGILPGLGAKFVAMEPDVQTSLRSYIDRQLSERQAQQQAAHAQAAQNVEKTAQLALEKQMILQVKGDGAPILGYVSTVTEQHLEFEPDRVPANSLLGRWQRQNSGGQLQGCIAVPVQIENHESGQPGGALRLHFLDPRGDLTKPLPQLTERLLSDTDPETRTSVAAIPAAPKQPSSGWASRLLFCLGIALSALLGTLLGAWILKF